MLLIRCVDAATADELTAAPVRHHEQANFKKIIIPRSAYYLGPIGGCKGTATLEQHGC